MTEYTVADYLLAFLYKQGQKHVFWLPGQHLDPMAHALMSSEIQAIICNHEVLSGYMAMGYSMATDRTACVLTIGGPGLTHVMTALLTAHAEQFPLLLMTGDVPTELGHLPSFQNSGEKGFKSLEVSAPYVKWHHRVTDANDFPEVLKRAYHISETTPRGVVHLQIPQNVLKQTFGADPPVYLPPYQSKAFAQSLVVEPHNALVFWGDRVTPFAKDALRMWSENRNIPVMSTLKHKAIMPTNHPLFLGVFGYGGHRRLQENLADISVSTLLLCGPTLNQRHTHDWRHPLFFQARRMIYLNQTRPDPDIQKMYPQLKWHPTKPEQFFSHQEDSTSVMRSSADWLTSLKTPKKTGTHTEEIYSKLGALLPEQAVIFVDSGTSKEWVGQWVDLKEQQQMFLSDEVGAMGWALGAALGFAFAQPDQRIFVFCGDGTLHMHGTQLAIAVQYHLPVTVILYNSRGYQSINSRLDAQGISYRFSLPEMNWKTFCQSLGLAHLRVSTAADLSETFGAFSKGPHLIEVDPR